MEIIENNGGLAGLVKRGGIYRNLQGTSPREVISALIKALPPVPQIPQEKLLKAVLEREELMPTGIGQGIALPHPRNPVIEDPAGQFVALAFLKNPVDWNSLDGKRVDTLLLIVSASAKQHLKTMSEITFLCRQNDFCQLLEKRASPEELLRFMAETEKNWRGDL